MKKRLILLSLVAVFFNNLSFAQAPSDALAKNTLRQIWIAYCAWNSDYWEPAKFITDPSTNKIVGQDFIAYNDEKYARISLVWQGEKPVKAFLKKDEVQLTWTGDQLSGIRIRLFNNFNYTIKYDGQGNAVELAVPPSGSLQMLKKVEYTADGRIAKITSYENKSGDPWIRGIKTFSYPQGEVTINDITYKTGKSNTPKNIISNFNSRYKMVKDNSYYVEQPWGEKVTLTYNDLDQVINKKKESGSTISEENYTYHNNTLFKMESSTTKDGVLAEKNVDIMFTRTDLPETLEYFQREKGKYRFDAKGDLVREARDGKYREKMNGVWSDWKFMSY